MTDWSDVLIAEDASVPSAPDVTVRYRSGTGAFVDTSLDRVSVDDVLAGLPVREMRWFAGRQCYSGWYWSATTGGHVVYESRLELARILLADHDPKVVSIAAQPFWLQWFDGSRMRRHVPDLLLGRADGSVAVVDVKAAHRLDDPKVARQFAWTERLVHARGWDFEVWSSADRVLLENVRFLAGYRRDAMIDPDLAEAVLDAVGESVLIAHLERSLPEMGEAAVIRPAILHLLWSGRLLADLSRPLGGATHVRLGVAA
ncbi:TnsA-like heteromeric transposase endonuclease subunit [Kitasatospora sp. NPDC088779]|uniref:TnsA-like heteromeric transposase endonuclease subunit n=1 Tax=unclassified Kitasatospora TaxID=2633591 RepID=UPI0034427E99